MQNQAPDLAATIAFWTFFSIFPTDRLPGSARLVRDNIEAVMRHRGTMRWVGIAGVLWTAAKGFGAITRAINRALGAERTRSYLLSAVRPLSRRLSPI